MATHQHIRALSAAFLSLVLFASNAMSMCCGDDGIDVLEQSESITPATKDSKESKLASPAIARTAATQNVITISKKQPTTQQKPHIAPMANAKSCDFKGEIALVLTGHEGKIVNLMPLNGLLISGSLDKHFAVWDLTLDANAEQPIERKCIKAFSIKSEHMLALPYATLNDGLMAFITSANNHYETINLLQMNDTKEATQRTALTKHHGLVTCVTQLHNGDLVSGSDDGTINIWDLTTDMVVKTFIQRTEKTFVYNEKPEYQRGTVECLANFGNKLAAGSSDGTINIWDLTANEKSARPMMLIGHTTCVNSLVFLDATHLASGSKDLTIKIWDLTTGECINTLTGHSDAVTSLALISKNVLASGASGFLDPYRIRLWDIATGTCIKTIKIPQWHGFVECLRALPNGILGVGCSTGDILVLR